MGVYRASNGHGRYFGRRYICTQTGRATESCFKTLNITSSINRTQLMRMDHFQEHGMQEQSDGKHVVVFSRRDAFSSKKHFPPSQKLSSWLDYSFQVEKALHLSFHQIVRQIVCPTA